MSSSINMETNAFYELAEVRFRTSNKIKPATVFPAKAGIQRQQFWVPAYAGTT